MKGSERDGPGISSGRTDGGGEDARGAGSTGSTEGVEGAERVELAARLHAAAIHLLRRVRRGDPASGLTPARLSALSVLVFGGPRTIGELASAEQVRAPTMTRLVAALEEDGYVAREPSPDDGRAVIVRATERAGEALEGARVRRVRHVLELLQELSAEEWRTVRAAVDLVERELARPERSGRK